MKSKKMIASLMASVTLLSVAAPAVASADVITSNSEENEHIVNNQVATPPAGLGVSASFDLQTLSMDGEEKTVTDANGNVVHFSVTPQTNPLARVANGAHKVNAWGLGWNVTFYVKTNSNNITSAYDLSYMIAMPVNSATVTRDNNKQATARFTFSTPVWNVLSWTGMVRAKIIGTDLIVYND